MGTNKGQMESGRETTRDAMTMEGHEELWRPKVPLVYQDRVPWLRKDIAVLSTVGWMSCHQTKSFESSSRGTDNSWASFVYRYLNGQHTECKKDAVKNEFKLATTTLDGMELSIRTSSMIDTTQQNETMAYVPQDSDVNYIMVS